MTHCVFELVFISSDSDLFLSPDRNLVHTRPSGPSFFNLTSGCCASTEPAQDLYKELSPTVALQNQNLSYL